MLTEELSRRHLSEEHPSKQKLKRWVSSYVISLQQVRTSPLSTPQPGAAFHQPLTKCVEQMAPAKWRGNKAKGALCEVCVWVSAWAGVSVCAGEVYPNRQDALCVRCVDFVEWMVILSVQRRVCVCLWERADVHVEHSSPKQQSASSSMPPCDRCEK